MDSLDIVLLILAAVLMPVAGLLAAADAAITMVSPARVEEIEREGRRGAALAARDHPGPAQVHQPAAAAAGRRRTVGHRARVAAVALSTWGFHGWVALAGRSS